jgi:hypothetical protein
MNPEYALNSIKYYLIANINSVVDIVEAEASAATDAPTIQSFKIGSYLPTELDEFPAVLIKAQKTSDKKDNYEHQERRLNFEIQVWCVNIDAEELQRFICRYAEAVVRVLRNENNWKNNLNSPKIGDATISDLFEVDHGLAQGSQILGSIDYIISNY